MTGQDFTENGVVMLKAFGGMLIKHTGGCSILRSQQRHFPEISFTNVFSHPKRVFSLKCCLKKERLMRKPVIPLRTPVCSLSEFLGYLLDGTTLADR